ncbi:MAG TPA: UDP-N-acetylmuramate dehydrogenase [Bryobacteraceae bacterium]
MPVSAAVTDRLAAIANLKIFFEEPLARHTRFGIGGPAAVFCDAPDEDGCAEALRVSERMGLPRVIMGAGTNLIVSDAGFDGVVIRYTGAGIERKGDTLRVQAGAVLQDVVDRSISWCLKGLETMTGIPGYLGGAVYGNAGAYGHSIQELVITVSATNGECIKAFRNEDCRFRYRDSIFKDQKEWVILSAELRFTAGDAAELANAAAGIRTIRDAKYPPTMKCAGSIFKNLMYADLPASVQTEIPVKLVREGKVPSAWFLEQAGVKGIRRGDIQVATYHANLIYNDGAGTAADLVEVIQDLKRRVKDRFGFELEEEVQYVGFEYATA